MASTLAKRCRKASLSEGAFDRMDRRFLRDVSQERLRVRTTTMRDMIRARHLLRFAGVIRKRDLGTGDAMIASSCLALAQEARVRVVFYTADWTLYTILRDLDAFTSALRLRYVGKPKGGIPAST